MNNAFCQHHTLSGKLVPIKGNSVRLYVEGDDTPYIEVRPTEDGRGLQIRGYRPVVINPNMANMVEVRLVEE